VHVTEKTEVSPGLQGVLKREWIELGVFHFVKEFKFLFTTRINTKVCILLIEFIDVILIICTFSKECFPYNINLFVVSYNRDAIFSM
jgi:hypothetical protein